MGKAKHINNKDASVTKEKMEVTIVILMKGEREDEEMTGDGFIKWTRAV